MLFLYNLSIYSIDACLLKKNLFLLVLRLQILLRLKWNISLRSKVLIALSFIFPTLILNLSEIVFFVSYCPITKASTNYRQRKGGGPNFVWVEPPVGIRAPMLCPCPLIGTSTPPPPHSSRPHLLLLSSPSSSTVIGHWLTVYFLIRTS